ncbi:MBL fold metallo-hydrolase [candidate division KSB1 bacterium]
MNRKILIVFFLLLLVNAGLIIAEFNEDNDLTIVQLSKNVIVLKAKEGQSPNNVIAISTKKGIVVIDTQISYSIALRTRKAIEDRFSRKYFVYVINTHNDIDHTGGNQVYSDVEKT